MTSHFFKNIIHNCSLNQNGFLEYGADWNCIDVPYILTVKLKKNTIISVNEKQFQLMKSFIYHIVVDLYAYGKIIIQSSSVDDIELLYVTKYKNPLSLVKHKYDVVYAFDKNYFPGAFTSIYSLMCNFDKNKVDDLNVNLILDENDLSVFNNSFTELLDKTGISKKFTMYVVNYTLMDKNISSTKCLKGGNHLLNLCNYARLLIGHLIDSDKVLYLDSDTIVQTDLSPAFDSIVDHDFVIYGNKSELTYKNILVSYNYDKVYDLLGTDFDLNQNVIYTGTIFINPRRFKDYFDDLIKIVVYHNSLKQGLYKLFTMSILNLCFWNKVKYFNPFLNNVVDLGYKLNLSNELLNDADVLDWSGNRKPWFVNGLYKNYWNKYNIMFSDCDPIDTNKNTIEQFKK